MIGQAVTTAALACLLFVSGAAALQINSPASLTQCVPAQLSWSDGQVPFYVSVIRGGDPSSAALKQWSATSDTSLTWVVDLPAGTSITLKVTDSTGAIAYSSQVDIAAGSETSCSSASSSVSTTRNAASSTGRSSSSRSSATTSTRSGATAATTSSFATAPPSARVTTVVPVTTSLSTTGSAPSPSSSANGGAFLRPAGASLLLTCAALAWLI